MNARKLEWQRENRRAFVSKHGYSTNAHYATGKLREAVLERDGRKCVKCGTTEAEHLKKWGRPITIDHKNKDRSENTMGNLQTLCLTCHGNKDLIARLRVQKIPNHKTVIVSMRLGGATYDAIAHYLGFSLTGIWKWCQKWGI